MTSKDLPSKWAAAAAAEICEKIQDGTHFSPKQQLQAGTYRYITAKNVRPWGLDLGDVSFLTEDDHRAIFRRCDPRRGDVLLVKDGVNAGDAAINTLDEEFSLLSSVCFLRPKPAVMVGTFLRYYLLSPAASELLAGKLSGTAIRRIVLHRIKDLVVRVAPLPEQHRIVEAIESHFTRLDDTVATLERVQRNLNRYRASVLKAAVEGRLVPTEAELARAESRDYEPASVLLERILGERRRLWDVSRRKGRYADPVAPKTAHLPELPEGWCWALLPQLGELNRGKSKHRPRNDPRLLGGPYPFIQTGDVKQADGFIIAHGATYSEFGLAQSRLWPAGTVCITIAANIADTGILKFDACFPDSVVGFLPAVGPLTPYVEYFLRTARDRLDEYAPGTAQKNINLQTLSEVFVPLPPMAEQARIIAEVERQLSVAKHCADVSAQDVARCQRLRRSILKWAFEGKLAHQDPTDEPASALLKRIKAVRATATPVRKGLRMNGRPKRTA